MTDRLQVLSESVAHLGDVAATIDPSAYSSPAYPSEWTIADTFSHLGSGAVISRQRFEDSIAHRESEPDFNASVWGEWNEKAPASQVEDCLVSDVALLSSLQAATEEQREAFQLSMGPFTFDFDGMVGLRLSEHVLHTWDIEVAGNPDAALATDAANAVLDGIQFIVGRTAQPTGEEWRVAIRTLDPAREFVLNLGTDSTELIETSFEGPADLELPAESLVRLIYGRLDEAHTPAAVSGDVIDDLRRVFPGF